MYEELDIEMLVERVRVDLNGEVPTSRIRMVVLDLAARYSEAKVKTYVPNFIHRETVALLRADLEAETPKSKITNE